MSTAHNLPDEDKTVLPAVASLVAAAGPAPSSLKADRKRWTHFARFCAANGWQALPASEATVLRYVRIHRVERSWGWRNSRHHVDTIRAVHRANELPDPTLSKVELLLDAIRNEGGVPKDHIAPLLPEDAGAMVAQLAAPLSRATTLRSAVAGQLARHARASIAELAAIRPSDVVARDAGWTVAVAGTVVAVDAERDAELAENLATLLPLVAEQHFLLAPRSTSAAARSELARSLRRMTRRAGFGEATLGGPYPGAALSPEDFAWWVAWADPWLAQRVRNAAYILTGLSCAYRHQNTRVLLVSDLEWGEGGFVARLRSNKIPSPTGAHVNLIPATHRGVDCDDLTCPACALSRWLRLRERAGITDPHLFCRLVNGPGPLSAENAWQLLKDAARAAGLDPKNIGTRSLRSGAASSMAMQGASTPEIALITHHRSFSVLAGYIRNLDPVHHRYHLPL